MERQNSWFYERIKGVETVGNPLFTIIMRSKKDKKN